MADELLQTLENRSSEDNNDDEEELEVKKMAQSILHYRTTIPDRFKKTFASLLIAQRPIHPHFGAETGIARDRNPDAGDNVESSKRALLAEEEHETADKLHLLKLRISTNVSAMTIILKRMNDCISMIDTLDEYNGSMHPAFKRKRTC